MTDSITNEYARDDAENRLDVLEARKDECMLLIQAAVDSLASYCGASDGARRYCLDLIDSDGLGDLIYERRVEIENLINDLTDQIERSDAPYRARVA